MEKHLPNGTSEAILSSGAVEVSDLRPIEHSIKDNQTVKTRNCLFGLVLFSFIAVIDLRDPEAVQKCFENGGEEIFQWNVKKEDPNTKRYGFFHMPDEAMGKLKTVGVWVEAGK